MLANQDQTCARTSRFLLWQAWQANRNDCPDIYAGFTRMFLFPNRNDSIKSEILSHEILCFAELEDGSKASSPSRSCSFPLACSVHSTTLTQSTRGGTCRSAASGIGRSQTPSAVRQADLTLLSRLHKKVRCGEPHVTLMWGKGKFLERSLHPCWNSARQVSCAAHPCGSGFSRTPHA